MKTRYQIPLEMFEKWLVAALTLIKAGNNGGRLQIKLLQELRSQGNRIPDDVAFEDAFFEVLEKQKGVRKNGGGSNPTWKLTISDISEVEVPSGLSYIKYPPEPTVAAVLVSPQDPPPKVASSARVVPVTVDEVKEAVVPAVRGFVVSQGSATKEQLLDVAKRALGGRDLPDSLFGKMCFLAKIARPDKRVDVYVRGKTTKGYKRKKKAPPAKTEIVSEPVQATPAVPAVLGEPPVIQLPGLTKLMFGSENLATITMEGDLSPLLAVIELPFILHGEAFSQVTITHGKPKKKLDPPWVMANSIGGISVGLELNLNVTIQVFDHIFLYGPWRIAVFRQALPK